MTSLLWPCDLCKAPTFFLSSVLLSNKGEKAVGGCLWGENVGVVGRRDGLGGERMGQGGWRREEEGRKREEKGRRGGGEEEGGEGSKEERE